MYGAMARRVLDSPDRASVVRDCDRCLSMFWVCWKLPCKRNATTIRTARLNLEGDTGSWQSASTCTFAIRDEGKETREQDTTTNRGQAVSSLLLLGKSGRPGPWMQPACLAT